MAIDFTNIHQIVNWRELPGGIVMLYTFEFQDIYLVQSTFHLRVLPPPERAPCYETGAFPHSITSSVTNQPARKEFPAERGTCWVLFSPRVKGQRREYNARLI